MAAVSNSGRLAARLRELGPILELPWMAGIKRISWFYYIIWHNHIIW